MTASSVHNPRQILDIKAADPRDGLDAKGKEIRRFRQLLVDIEKVSYIFQTLYFNTFI